MEQSYHLKFTPDTLGHNVVKTGQSSVVSVLWQELKALRFTSTVDFNHVLNRDLLVPLIDQSKDFYEEAVGSKWNVGGLSYYYSFLNLAKGLLVSRNRLTEADINSSKVYHGLSCDSQFPDSILDYELCVHPSNGGQLNIFAMLYEAILGER